MIWSFWGNEWPGDKWNGMTVIRVCTVYLLNFKRRDNFGGQSAVIQTCMYHIWQHMHLLHDEASAALMHWWIVVFFLMVQILILWQGITILWYENVLSYGKCFVVWISFKLFISQASTAWACVASEKQGLGCFVVSGNPWAWIQSTVLIFAQLCCCGCSLCPCLGCAKET